MKKLPKGEKRVHKVYWLLPDMNRRLKKMAKRTSYSESSIVEMALKGFIDAK